MTQPEPGVRRVDYSKCGVCNAGEYFCGCAEPEIAAEMQADLEAILAEGVRDKARVEKKTFHLGHVPGTVIVDKAEIDHLRTEVERQAVLFKVANDQLRLVTDERDQLRAQLKQALDALDALDAYLQKPEEGVQSA